jgi:NADH:ubiquinone reductase (non-electrogenic)
VIWSAGNSARQLVKDLVAAIPDQAQYQRGPTPVTNKLAVDPFLRVIGASDLFAIGDNSMVVGARLPPTGQVGFVWTDC